MQINFWNIYKTFFKIGTMLLGGGYVILPLLQSEIVDKNGWAKDEDIVEYYALSQSLPGIIAANISIFTGHKLMGIRGAVAALSGVIMPAFLAIVLIADILSELVEKHSVQSMFAGVAVGVVILVILTIKEMWSKSIVDKFTCMIFVLAFVLASVKVSPVWIILSCVVIGIIYGAVNSKEVK